MNSGSRVRNIIAKALGVFWVLDGLLQLQPKMFGADFVNSILVPNLVGQPFFIHPIIAFGIFLWNLNPVTANALAALIQITIGILVFFPISDRRFRTGLYLSIVWGLIVWLCGEGAGLLFTGTASFYTGAPGSVLIYIVISVLLLMDERVRLTWLPKIAGWTFIFGSALQLQSFFWGYNGVQNSIMASSMEAFHVVNAFPIYIAHLLSINPVAGNILLVCIPFVIGLALLLKPNRITGAIALTFLFFVWWLGQDFGMLTAFITGTSTDPNAAPLLALLIIPLFFRDDRTHAHSSAEQKKPISTDSLKNLTGLLLFVVIVLGVIVFVQNVPAPQLSSMGPGGMAPMGMTLKAFDLKPSDPVPSVAFSIARDPVSMGGWDVHITTTNFIFTPQNVNTAPVADQGHAHLYVDNTMYVVYGDWYHLDDVPSGKHLITVSLMANDHSIFSENGRYIEATTTIEQ